MKKPGTLNALAVSLALLAALVFAAAPAAADTYVEEFDILGDGVTPDASEAAAEAVVQDVIDAAILAAYFIASDADPAMMPTINSVTVTYTTRHTWVVRPPGAPPFLRTNLIGKVTVDYTPAPPIPEPDPILEFIDELVDEIEIPEIEIPEFTNGWPTWMLAVPDDERDEDYWREVFEFWIMNFDPLLSYDLDNIELPDILEDIPEDLLEELVDEAIENGHGSPRP